MKKYIATEDVKQGDMIEIIDGEKVRKIRPDDEWVKIGYDQIPKEIFDKYGAKPFEIMKRKMRNKDGNVWNNINYFEAQKECEKLGCRLLKIQELLTLLEWYKTKNKKVSYNDKEFLGIEELSYEEDVCYEWIYVTDDICLLRGGSWAYGSGAGAFTAYLVSAPSSSNSALGFRCVR
jgi:hypothetical protein